MGYFLLSIFVMRVSLFSFSESRCLLQHFAALCKLLKSSERKKKAIYITPTVRLKVNGPFMF